MTTSAQSNVLINFIASNKPTRELTKTLIKLERFVIDGVESFGGTSIMIQGRGINATMTRHRNLYVAMVLELKGEDEAQKVLKRGEPGILIKTI